MKTEATPCLICAGEQASPDAVVFRDEHWAGEVVPGYEVPGWVILRTRRHAERITALNDDELTSFGPRARDLVAAVSEVMDAPTTYLMVFGENYPHFHVLVAPRGADVPIGRRGGDILRLRDEFADLGAAHAVVPMVRAAYDARVSPPPGPTAT